MATPTTRQFLASIDPGNQNIDVMWCEMKRPTGKPIKFEGEKHKTFPSLVTSEADEFLLSRVDSVDGTGEKETRQFGIGDYPQAEWIKDSPDGKSQWVLPCLIHAMWSDLKDGDSIKVYTSVHNLGAFREEMKAALNGTFEIVRDDITKKITVSCDRVLVEGVGAIKSASPKTLANMLLDIGGQTVMIAPYSGLKLLQGCDQPYQLEHQGTARLIAEFTKCEAVTSKLKRVLTYKEARSIIDNRTHAFEGHDFSAAVADEVDRWLTAVMAKAASLFRAHEKDCPNKYATGGALLIPSVEEWLKAKGYIPVADPLHANVKGVFALAQTIEGKA